MPEFGDVIRVVNFIERLVRQPWKIGAEEIIPDTVVRVRCHQSDSNKFVTLSAPPEPVGLLQSAADICRHLRVERLVENHDQVELTFQIGRLM